MIHISSCCIIIAGCCSSSTVLVGQQCRAVVINTAWQTLPLSQGCCKLLVGICPPHGVWLWIWQLPLVETLNVLCWPANTQWRGYC